jgi:hypothetical protein
MHNINLETDELLALGEACRLLPIKPSPATLWRWRTKGVRAGNQRIWLECVRVGGRWYTTRAAMARFISQQTAAATPIDDEPRERSALTERKLDEAGLI